MADEDFRRLVEPYRRELLAHCYRMVGSVHEAEDLLQETYLRAWRSYEKFEGRSSLRTWLYKIATSACLTALAGRRRRPLPTGLGGPGDDPAGVLDQRAEVPWLEPVPDALVADPAAIVTARESVRLALVATLQHLPPRQRAVLILRDVLKWRAAEVAELLETTTAAVNSTLQRARAQLEQVAPTEQETTEPSAPAERELLDRYVAAFEAKDIAALVELFTKDAVWEMPPFASWFQGRRDIGRLIETHAPYIGGGDFRLYPTRANGQPAFACHLHGEAFSLQVLTLTPSGVSHVVNFHDPRLVRTYFTP